MNGMDVTSGNQRLFTKSEAATEDHRAEGSELSVQVAYM